MAKVRIFNTLSQKVEEFTPFSSKEVKMYVCGVTPYDTSHLGHAFVFTFFDVVKRVFTHLGYKVTYVQNVTDIDDPLIERAAQLNTTWEKLTDQWTHYLLNDFLFLNIPMPDYYVKATEELETMKKINAKLIADGFAYVKDGNVYFSIAKFPKYGKLSKLSREEMLKKSSEMGGDITDKNKRDPLDFLLWKKSKEGEPSWESPWSKGRPGWHIECTAMSTKYLGDQIDIHGGGADLIFPHHESEIAQAEAYSGKSPFVKTWMHCGMVYLNGQKMSKSLGNLVYVQDLAKKYSANAIRYYILSHHYRLEWEYDEEKMQAAAEKMFSVEKSLESSESKNDKIDEDSSNLICEDFNIPQALEIMYKTDRIEKKEALFSTLGFK